MKIINQYLIVRGTGEEAKLLELENGVWLLEGWSFIDGKVNYIKIHEDDARDMLFLMNEYRK